MSHAGLALILPLLVIGAVNAQAATEKPVDLWREARLSLSADGKVTAIKFDAANAQKDVVADRLEPVIRAWTFASGKVDGQPMATETSLHLHLQMRKTGDGAFAVSVLSAQTGVGALSVTPPMYPMEQLNGGIEAKIPMLLTVDASGVITDLKFEKEQSNGSRSDVVRFETAVRLAANHWRYQPEVVGGHPLTAQARTSVKFCLGKDSGCDKFTTDKAVYGNGNGGVVAINSHARLLTPVAGVTY